MILTHRNTVRRPYFYGHPFAHIQHDLEQAFTEGNRTAVSNSLLAVDLREQSDHFLIEIDVPGIAQDNIQLTFDKGVFTVEAERPEPEGSSLNKIRDERHYGTLTRSIRLGDQVASDKAKATLNNGVLTVQIPKMEAKKPTQIAIKAK